MGRVRGQTAACAGADAVSSVVHLAGAKVGLDRGLDNGSR
jgi:hypothetical protein